MQNVQKCNPPVFVAFDELSVLSLGTYRACCLDRAFLQIKLWSYADARVVRCRNASNLCVCLVLQSQAHAMWHAGKYLEHGAPGHLVR